MSSAEAYRRSVRGWLDEHLTDRYRGLRFDGSPDLEWLTRMREWNHLLADARYAAPSWPEAFGGRDADVLEQAAHAEEFCAAGAPGPINAIGIPNIAPAIMMFGTRDQQARFLRPLLRGDEVWCQAFSEPDAGSDLAGLGCEAVLDGDHYVVNGQKVWTTLGPIADWCELLVRTSSRALKKQGGITTLLVDMKTPGVEVRPLRTINGTTEFSEVFFTSVRVPVFDRLGEENDGWRVARATLANERSGVASLHLQLQARIDELVEQAQNLGLTTDRITRQRLATLWSAGRCLGLLSDRAVAALAAGQAATAESSVIKIAWSEVGQLLPEVALDVLGPAALDGEWGADLVHSRSLTIAGGTSEVNRNIVAERILGLPRG